MTVAALYVDKRGHPRRGGTPTHVVTTSRAAGTSLPELTRHWERHVTPLAFAEFLVDIARRAAT